MTRPAWPVPAGKGAARAAENTANRAADLEAQASNLRKQMTADLIGMLEATVVQASDICALTTTPNDVRQLAERVMTENRSRAASLRQVANLPRQPASA